jgi:hypothetical protein
MAAQKVNTFATNVPTLIREWFVKRNTTRVPLDLWPHFAIVLGTIFDEMPVSSKAKRVYLVALLADFLTNDLVRQSISSMRPSVVGLRQSIFIKFQELANDELCSEIRHELEQVTILYSQ